MAGSKSFYDLFKQRTFVSSSEIARRYGLQKALASNYAIPCFFKGAYYVPSMQERKGHFIGNPGRFFQDLFNFIYGRGKWYWSLTTAARYYGLEWGSSRLLEIVVPFKPKKIDVFGRVSSLRKKTSHRSKILFQMLSSLEVNYIVIHEGKMGFLKETKLDSELGQVATKARMLEDIRMFLPKTKVAPIRRIYKSILAKASLQSQE